jgi:hypothetical protein
MANRREIDLFLSQLATVDADWRLTEIGSIRCMYNGTLVCPIMRVARLTHYPILSAAEEVGLSRDNARAIIKAADNPIPQTKLRKLMLTACHLAI